ncbi:hypothetical protein ACIQI8_27260 [Streptomyces sp. NPDC092369]|uniref:hypothetical protein n=1 Tax=Streptomyces sp. NPDC092369 TaxID=3366015 RepID=UPI00380A5AD5
MTYRVDLSVHAEDALAELRAHDQREVLETIAAALVQRNAWPPPGGWDATTLSGSRWWITFTAYVDGIDILSIGCA